ncbi:MAG: YcaO-like family protein [Bifidobacteriaceae bacterium]|nr:YcaO-like family protein [Bifidobacteriaceae bacterium]
MGMTADGESAPWTWKKGFDTVLVFPEPAMDQAGFAEALQLRCSDVAERLVFGSGREVTGRDVRNGLGGFAQSFGVVEAAREFARMMPASRPAGGIRLGWPVLEIDVRAATVRRHVVRTASRQGHATPTITVGAQGANSWRRQGLDSLPLPPDMLAGHGLGYLGHPGGWGLDWTTASPVSDRLWIDLGGAPIELSWSGHEDSFDRSLRACLLEGVERTVGALGGGSHVVTCPAAELDARYYGPDAFGRFPPSAYGVEVEEFSSWEPHEWITTRSLVTGERVYVPLELAHYGREVRRRWALGTSSGWAVGSTPQEAAFFGLLELVERDAVVSGWYAGITPKTVDAATVEGIHDVLTRAGLLGCRFHLSCVPSDLGIPVIVAAAEVADAFVFGSAAHPDPERAVVGAVKEAWTYLPERERHARRLRRAGVLPATDFAAVRSIHDHASLAFKPTGLKGLDRFKDKGPEHSVPLGEIRPWQMDDAGDGPLGGIVSALAAKGLEPLATVCASATADAIGVSVVGTLVPGLVPIDFGWNRQRALQMNRTGALAAAFGSAPPSADLAEPHPFS